MIKLEIDDPLDAFSVHGACGLWGVIAVGIFDIDNGLVAGKSQQFGGNCLGAFVIIVWVCTMGALIFYPLKKLGLLRVTEEIEEAGLDLY